MKNKKANKSRKTQYCIHSHNCDRPENCFYGESCPFMEVEGNWKPPENLDCERWFDDIWEFGFLGGGR